MCAKNVVSHMQTDMTDSLIMLTDEKKVEEN